MKKLTGRDYALYALRKMQYRDKSLLDEQRAAAETVNDLSFARLGFSIPQDHYEMATMCFPELQSPDAQIKTKAWQKFAKNDLGKPYLMNPKERLNAR